MMFIATTDGRMVLLLTEQDCSDMRGGRTKFVDETVTKGMQFTSVVLSLHKDQEAAKDILRRAGHGAVLEGLPSPVAKPTEGTCTGCGGIMPEPQLHAGKCICCWHESSQDYRRMWMDEVSSGGRGDMRFAYFMAVAGSVVWLSKTPEAVLRDLAPAKAIRSQSREAITDFVRTGKIGAFIPVELDDGTTNYLTRYE